MNVFTRTIAMATALVLAIGTIPLVAQVAYVSSSDIERLQYAIADARAEISQMGSRSTTLSDKLERELEELNEEVIYLKVRVRKERNVPRSEYSLLRDRIDDLRISARTPSSRPSSSESSRPSDTRPPSTSTTRRYGSNQIPVGQELDVRLQAPLNSGTAQVEDRFEATTLVDLSEGDRVIVPAGSVLRGVVTSVDPATRTDRKGSLTLSFDQITVNGRSFPIRATVTQALESEGLKGEAGRIATGAGVGAIIGGILGGFKGALAGILIGGGGTVVATEGKDVDLPAGTVLRVRFDETVTLS
jgi:hypothetical protein